MSTYTNEEMSEVIRGLQLKIAKLSGEMEEASKASAREPIQYESGETNKLSEAFAKAQLEMEEANQKSTNPFFKSQYADLGSVVRASRMALGKHGLSMMQRVIPSDQGKSYLHTRMMHASGQWMESRMEIDPPKKDIQSLGSYITYLRRYTYSSMVGVISGNEDDDGEAAMRGQREEAQEKAKCISQGQLLILSTELEGHSDILERILKASNIKKLSQLPAARYNHVVENLRSILRSQEKEA